MGAGQRRNSFCALVVQARKRSYGNPAGTQNSLLCISDVFEDSRFRRARSCAQTRTTDPLVGRAWCALAELKRPGGLAMSHGPLCDRPPSPQPASVDGANVTRRGAKWQNEPIERDAACSARPDTAFGT